MLKEPKQVPRDPKVDTFLKYVISFCACFVLVSACEQRPLLPELRESKPGQALPEPTMSVPEQSLIQPAHQMQARSLLQHL